MFKKLPKFNDQSYTHFVTTNTANRCPYFAKDDLCQILVDNIKFYEAKYSLEIYGWVIMPDHLHLLVWWDADKQPELTISKIIQGIKGSSARQMIDYLKNEGLPERRLRPTQTPPEQRLRFTRGSSSREPLLPTQTNPLLPTSMREGRSHKRNLKYQIWQPNFYDFNIYSDYKLEEKTNYLKMNAVRAGLAKEWWAYNWLYLKNK